MRLWTKGLHAIGPAAGLMVLCAVGGYADLIGTVNVSGSVVVGATTIDFPGTSTVSASGNTGSFASLNNTSATVLNLNEMVQIPGPAGFAPLMAWVTFAAAPADRFDLTEIDGGVFSVANCFVAPAPGQTCTPPGFSNGAPNPFNLNNTTTTNSSASITVHGNAVDAATGEVDTFSGILSTQFGLPYQTLLATIQGGAAIGTSYSATFTVTPTTVIPEPASLILLGSSLIGFFAFCRYRRS